MVVVAEMVMVVVAEVVMVVVVMGGSGEEVQVYQGGRGLHQHNLLRVHSWWDGASLNLT